MPKLQLYNSVPEFLAHVGPSLRRDTSSQSLHSVLLSLAGRLVSHGQNATLLASAWDDRGEFEIAGLRTDPQRALVLSCAEPGIARRFAALLKDVDPEMPGANGPEATVDAFAAEWCRLQFRRIEIVMQLKLFELTKVIPPRQPEGAWRAASAADETLLACWNTEFFTEAVPHDPREEGEALARTIRSGIAGRRHFLWEVGGQAVCWVATPRETETERWIAPVYTPKAHRGQGYASALVAAVSQLFLGEGKSKCLLFTDAANPTSNGIYQALGYRPVAGFRQVSFVK